jgi:enterochelin esterase-like enzyme
MSCGNNDQSTGSDVKGLMESFKRREIRFEFHETEGGHARIHWCHDLNEFAQRLFY